MTTAKLLRTTRSSRDWLFIVDVRSAARELRLVNFITHKTHEIIVFLVVIVPRKAPKYLFGKKNAAILRGKFYLYRKRDFLPL